jgi:hypothetical protein
MANSPNTILPSRSAQLTGLRKLTDGLKKHEQALPMLVIQGQSYKTADLIAVLQARYDAANAVLLTKAAWQNAVKADHDERSKTQSFLSGLRQALLVAFGGSIDSMADFGLVPRKKPTMTPEERVAANEKAQATRKARHTMGKNQKAQIKGEVPATTPPTAPSTPPVAAQPAPAGNAAPAPQPGTTPAHS